MLQNLALLLTAIFAAAKVFGAVNWGWLVVLSPVFVYLLIVLVFLTLFVIMH